MSKKVLTVSVAAYNVEAYIENALRSLCVPEIIDKLEIFVVDDGGTDGTLGIAKAFAARYPASVFPVHKENGGYGSTVNYSLSHATGKYFKLLDGDDWFDSEGLRRLVSELENSAVDIVMNNYKTGPDPEHLTVRDFYAEEGGGVKDLSSFVAKRDFGMWAMTFRTEILRACGLTLPEHVLYTDALVVAYPLAAAKTMRFFDFSVYCYRVGRDGQSMSKEAIKKHYREMIGLDERLAAFCARQESSPNYPIIRKRVSEYHAGTVHFMLLLPVCRESLREIKALDKRVRAISEDVYRFSGQAGHTGALLRVMRRTGYLPYWGMKFLQGKLKY
ncbi:MAG: glycosyltransferase family 2 protein [Clostridia bacterium]|nr:glycosyltransferase family 2 protein [Clostridia bacterium]MBR0406752.1 glycosyltransferase family 2 protein [Clostridia bacterium]